MSRKIAFLGKRIALLACILALWKVGSMHTNALFIPPPEKVLTDFYLAIGNGTLLLAIQYSLRRIFIATALAAGLSIPVGLLVYNTRWAKDVLNPIINVVRYLPITAFAPLLMMYTGIGEEMKITYLFIAMFVYMCPSVLLCLNEIPEQLMDTAYTIGMNKWKAIYMVQLPYTIPSILNSLIVSVGIGFTYIASAEGVNAIYGLGWSITQNSSRGRTDMVFMCIIVIIVVSIAFDMVAKGLVRKVFRWKFYEE